MCGSEKTEPRFPGSGLPIARCSACRSVFRISDVTDSDLAALYDKDYYFKTWPGSLGRFFRGFDPRAHHKTRFLLRQLHELERLTGKAGKLLDVGTANGVFVWLARERGWTAEGVELSPFAAKWGVKQFEVSIHQGVIQDLDPSPHFDVITLWDTLEHMPDPAGTLHACFQRLLPGGILAVLTPDASSLINFMVHAAYRAAPARSLPYLEKLYHSDHLTYFDRHSLCTALVGQGFETHWIESYDEDPRDTETEGGLRMAVYAVHLMAALVQRRHEIMVWAARPEEAPI